jgi:hypothetical protein
MMALSIFGFPVGFAQLRHATLISYMSKEVNKNYILDLICCQIINLE